MLEMLLSSDEDVTVPFDGKPRLAVVVPTQELIHQLHDTLLQVAPSMERLVKVEIMVWG
jgi:superfamily II DNA/RNA helicase